MNFQMFKLDLEKIEEPEIKLTTSVISYKKEDNSRKKHLLLLYDYAKAFDGRSQQNVKNSSRDGNTRPPYLLPEKSGCHDCMQVKKQQLELDMEQYTVSKLGKEYVKAVFC